jgi:hypothetical protein
MAEDRMVIIFSRSFGVIFLRGISGTSLRKCILVSLTLFADFSRHYVKKQSRRGNYCVPPARILFIFPFFLPLAILPAHS